MGTLQEQQRDYEAAVAYIENLKASDGPYKLSEHLELSRQLNALLNQASYGAFRHAPQEQKSGLGMREKQQWEGLGNITRVEAMRRFTTKTEEIKIAEDLANKAHAHAHAN